MDGIGIGLDLWDQWSIEHLTVLITITTFSKSPVTITPGLTEFTRIPLPATCSIFEGHLLLLHILSRNFFWYLQVFLLIFPGIYIGISRDFYSCFQLFLKVSLQVLLATFRGTYFYIFCGTYLLPSSSLWVNFQTVQISHLRFYVTLLEFQHFGLAIVQRITSTKLCGLVLKLSNIPELTFDIPLYKDLIKCTPEFCVNIWISTISIISNTSRAEQRVSWSSAAFDIL